MTATGQFNDWADLYRACKEVEVARLGLQRVLDRGSFPDLERIISGEGAPDPKLRDAVARLKTLVGEAEKLRDQE